MGCVSCFLEAICFYEDRAVVGERPKAAVEKPVGGLGERDSVCRVAGAAAFELVDVGCVERSGAVHRDHSVAGECAGEVVGGQDAGGEFRVALLLIMVGRKESRGIGGNEVVGRNGEIAEGVKFGAFGGLEVFGDEGSAGEFAESGVA